MQTLCIAICEDNLKDALELRRLIGLAGISADIHTYENTEVFLSVFKPGSFQLAFLDIYFNDPVTGDEADGIEASRKIREADADIWIAFTTSSPDHAAFGYKVKADRYLSKPLDEAEVLSLIERAAKHFEELSDEIFVTVDRRRRGIRLRDIRYVEARNKQSVIHLQDEAIVSYIKIDELEKLLRLPSFLRCHRSFIANMDYVENIGRDFEMQGGGTVYIGHISQWKVRKAYRDYIERLAREGRQ